MRDTDTLVVGALLQGNTPDVAQVVFSTDQTDIDPEYRMDWGGPWIGAIT
jgi:hypothetical protein